MNKFLIPANQLTEKITGIGRYMYETLTSLDILLENENSVEVIVCYPKEKTFIETRFKNIKVIPLEKKNKRWLPGVVIPYANKNNLIVCDMAIGITFKKNSIATIYDLRPYIRKEFDSIKTKINFRLVLFFAKRNAKIIVTVSESQKYILKKLMPNKNVIVIPNSWDHVNKYKINNEIFEKFQNIKKNEYYFTLGSIAKHKNYRWVAEVAKRNPTKQFVVAGNLDIKKWGTSNSSFFNLDNIVFVGYVSDEECLGLYKNCKAFLHPSHFEGFGIPPLEAFSLGKNIALSNLEVFKETYGDTISYFDPYDYDFDLDSIIIVSEQDRKKIINKYSWLNSAKMWLDLFKKY